MYAFVNCDIFTGSEFLYDCAIKIEENRIHSLVSEDELSDTIEKIDLKGATVSPGFFDLQVNGGGGVLLNDSPTVDGVRAIFEGHKKYGTTDFLPTYITGPSDGMRMAADAVNNCLENNLYGVRGIHFEGPFLNELKAGVHDKKYIREVNDADISIINSIAQGVTLLTLAPETVSSQSIKNFTEKGVLVSLGHTNATFQEANSAFKNGASCSTHLYNAMSALSSRAPGVVGASLIADETWAGIIVDGFHSDYGAVKVAHKAKANRKLFLVTDAMPPVGGKEGVGFTLGDYDITVENGRCITMGNVLAGSALDMATAVRNCIQHVGIDKGEALRMASTYPAEYVGLDHIIGHIKKGYDANLTIINNQVDVQGIVVQGKYEKIV